jgi:hypothetical protein
VEDLQPGDPRLVGSYRLLKRLGSGGMGRVYLGQSPGGRLVAVKVIRPELAENRDFRIRFAHEVAAARRVSGAFTAPVVDADPDAAAPWLVTSYVDGPSLANAIAAKGPMTATAALALALGLAEGLAAIHAAGVVHRDLKPSNVLLAADGPRIIDFGISRAVDATTMTEAGLVVGSPGFMSPEQVNGEAVGPASDVFSLGTVLAYAATGSDPFGTGHPQMLLYRVVHGSPALGQVPESLRPVVEQCMNKDPAQRPASRDLLIQLASLGSDVPAWADGWAGMSRRVAPAERPAGSRAGYSPTTPAHPRARNDGPEFAPRTGERTAPRNLPIQTRTAPRRRRFSPAWIAAAAAIVIGCATAGFELASHGFGSPRISDSAPATHKPSSTAWVNVNPQKVVEAFIYAINAHDWKQVWQLGGKNVAPSYASMVAGFRHTKRDVITSITSHGDTVNLRVRSFETTGVQAYAFSYTVRGGVITAGKQTLLGTKRVQ